MNPNNPLDLPLRDIHLPDPIAWWPPAPGWWLLPLALAGMSLALWWWYHTRARRLLRRDALLELTRIEQALPRDDDRHACASALSRLCRRLLLAGGEQQAAASADAQAITALERLLGLELPAAQRGVLLAAPYSPRAAGGIERETYTELITSLRAAIAAFTPRRDLSSPHA